MNNNSNCNCPQCGAAIPEDAPAGLCPHCVFERAASTAIPRETGGIRTAPPTVEEIAQHFPDLEVLELLGAGGMGAVYKARQPQLDRTVALKILSHDLASDPAFVERFNREAKMLARLSHPNIVTVFNSGTAGPYCYLVMEYIDGVNLRQAMQAVKFSPAESLAMVEEICSALKYAHEEGILHRDIKPENILIDSKGRVKIADFGIAKLLGEGRQYDFTLTMQGAVLGSPHYMAPEQIETPGDIDQRVDIYSLGVVFYELLTGELPIGRFALPSEKREMDARIDAIVLRTLQKERQARYQTADEMKTEVKSVATSPPASIPVSKSTPPAGEKSSARHSLTSVILTGISLPFGLIVAYLIHTTGSATGNLGWPVISEAIGNFWVFLTLLAFLGTSIPGFIRGAQALNEIRSSGGTKCGIDGALFGATAWPIILLFVIAMFCLPFAGLRWTDDCHLPVAVSIAFTASILLVWFLRRWALCATRKNGSAVRPGLGFSLVIVGFINIGGPILIAQLLTEFNAPEDPLSYRMNPYNYYTPTIKYHDQESIQWREGEPEKTIDLKIVSNYRAQFFLVLKDENGKAIKISKIGEWKGRHGRQTRFDLTLKIGTIGNDDAESDTDNGFAAHLNLTGESGEITGVPDIGDWQLVPIFDHDYNLYSSAEYGFLKENASIRVGECHKMIDGVSTVTGTLELEVRSDLEAL